MHANQGEIIHTAWRHFLGDLYFTFPGKSTCINILLELGDQLTHTHTLLLNTILIIVQCIIYMSWNRTVLHWIPPPPILPLTLSNSKCWPKGNLSQSYCYYIIYYNYFHHSRRKGRERDTKSSSSSCTVRQILSKIRFIFDIQPPSLK